MFVKFAELPVFDQDRAIAFYTAHLGLEVARDASYGDDGWRWIELAFSGEHTRLLFARRPDDTPSDHPVLVLVSDDVKGVAERLAAAGAEIITEPKEAPWQPDAVFAEFRDSEGNRIVLSSS